jgi:hypothetical protein
LLALCLAAMPASAITIQLNYDYHNGFFPVGSPARASLEAAASYFSSILDDTFSSIQTPPNFVGNNGTVVWHWTMNFNNPSTNSPVVRTDQTVAADQYRVFVGAQNLAGDKLGVGGPGGFGWSRTPTGTFSNGELAQINQIHDNFVQSVEDRHETSGFANWGGVITFDTVPQNAWHFNHTTPPPAGQADFYSVAIHELAHALGFGQDDTNPGNVTPWESYVSGTSFFGSNAVASYGEPVPLNPTDGGSPDLSHWADGTSSVVYGGVTAQETAMDRDLTSGTRKHFTALDAAAMKDIGWTVIAPPAPPPLFGDYNNNGIVDAGDYVTWRKRLGQSVTIPNDQTPGTVTSGDYTVWRNNFGMTLGAGAGSALGMVPEPSTMLLAIANSVIVGFSRRKRHG